MSDTRRGSRANRAVIDHLEDEHCPACERGRLEAPTYEGDVALVCDGCGTPRVRFWDVERAPPDVDAPRRSTSLER